MDESDDDSSNDESNPRAALCYGDTIDIFHVGQIEVVQRYACIRRDQFEWTTPEPFPPSFRDYLATRGNVRGTAALYVLDIPLAFQLTVAPNAGRAVFVPRLSTELPWQKNTVVEIVSVLDEMRRFV